MRALQRVKLWPELPDSRFPGSTYHWSADWLRANGMNPDKAGGIQISTDIAPWSTEQPAIIVHEFAHAFEAQVLGDRRAEFVGAFQAAKLSGK